MRTFGVWMGLTWAATAAAGAAADPVAFFFGLPRPAGASLDVVLTEGGKAPTHGLLDLKREAGSTLYRVEMVDGPQKGTRALLDLRLDGGADHLYAFRPALGVEAVSYKQLVTRFHALGVPLQDLVDIVQPERAGARAAWSGSATGAELAVQAPADAAGCRDTWVFPSASAALPSRASLCADAPWGAREATFSGEVVLGDAKLPSTIALREATGRSVTVQLSPSATARWQAAGRFDRSALSSP